MSLRTKRENLGGDMCVGWLPVFASLSLTVGWASALRTSALIFLTRSADMPAGPHTPNHSGASAPLTPASPVVGTSGSVGLRVAVLTASARSLPLLMWGSPAGIGTQSQSTQPRNNGCTTS